MSSKETLNPPSFVSPVDAFGTLVSIALQAVEQHLTEFSYEGVKFSLSNSKGSATYLPSSNEMRLDFSLLLVPTLSG